MHNFNEWYLSELDKCTKKGVKWDFLISSSASMASQVIRETTPDGDELFAAALIEDDDDMSECTLKDFAKKVPASSRKGKRKP